MISSLASESESIIDIDKVTLREFDSDSSTDYSDLENSTKSSRQQFNHHISRTSSNDSGICSGQITPKSVTTNSFDDESDDEELDNNLFNEGNNLVDTVPLVSKSTLKLNFF